MASGSHAGTSANAYSSSSSNEEEIMFSCAVGVPSKTDEAGTLSQMTLILDWPSMVNGAVNLILE